MIKIILKEIFTIRTKKTTMSNQNQRLRLHGEMIRRSLVAVKSMSNLSTSSKDVMPTSTEMTKIMDIMIDTTMILCL
jgi:regulator of replication initiation timing